MAVLKRRSTAVWTGNGAEGKGQLTSTSGVLDKTPYSFHARFKDEEGRSGTNPEELVAAAHSGCFAMKLAFVLAGAGFTADELNVRSTISMDEGVITGSHLELTARIPGIAEDQFAALAEEAKANCPISKLLAVPVTIEAKLSV